MYIRSVRQTLSIRRGTSVFITRSLSTSPAIMSNKVNKSESEWQAILSPEQFRVLRQKGTESPGTGKYDKFNGKGIYNCAACDQPLYQSSTKFDAHCGWPAFYDAIPGSITTTTDKSFGMERTEMNCSACGSHLGHIFKGEGYDTPTDARHCVNSISLNFKTT